MPARGILPPGLGYNPKLRSYSYDPQRARDLLAEAGYPGGRGLPPIAVWSSVKERVLLEHELIRRDLEAVGIKAAFQRYVRNVEVNGLGDAYIPLRKIWLERRG